MLGRGQQSRAPPAPAPSPCLRGREAVAKLPPTALLVRHALPELLMISAPSVTSTLPQPGPGPAPWGRTKCPRQLPGAAPLLPAAHLAGPGSWPALPRWYREWWPRLRSPLNGRPAPSSHHSQGAKHSTRGLRAHRPACCSPSWGPLLPRRAPDTGEQGARGDCVCGPCGRRRQPALLPEAAPWPAPELLCPARGDARKRGGP